jgi:pimeloyl-ACP methyl ester carboxylesterase
VKDVTDLGLPAADRMIAAAVPISVRDYGRHPSLTDDPGWGGDVLLLPAVGGDVLGWDAVAVLLRGLGYRPVAVDPRGHGRSGTGPWTWPAVLADLDAVVEALDLRRPAVVGHALGGALATLWAGHHPECPLAVSIDGYGNPTRPEQLAALAEVGVDPAETVTAFSRYLAEAIARVPRPLGDALRAVEGLDVLGTYRAVRCPTVAVLSDASDLAEVFPTELGLAWLVYVDWMREQLAAVASEAPLFSVATTAGPNDAYLSHPEHLAGLLATLLPDPTLARQPNETRSSQ